VLYYWDGQSDLVTDIDYVVWGDKAEAVDKTGVALDGPDADTDASTYQADTAISSQDALGSGHASEKSWQREDMTEGTEATSGGNGVGGADETSENLSVTWCEDDPTPNAATVCDGGGAGQEAKIHEVQGSGPNIAISGTVIVEAIVVGDYQGDDELRGFFIQEEDADADADPNTSEGIFVYCGFCDDAVVVGDLVQVTGLAEDFFDMSQIDVTESGSSVVVVSSGNALPTPAIVDLPASGSTEAAATFENVEGMLVSFTDTLYVSEYFELARYGQLVLTADARPRQFTDEFEPGVAEYAAFLADLESKRIILDDENNTQNAPLASNPADDTPYYWPTPGLSDTNYVRGGDSISGLTGVMHWSFAGQSGTDAWRIRPVTEAFTYDFTAENPRTAAPDEVGGSFTVASFNVLNYFTTIDSRGADSLVELDRQREKIAAAICAMDADVVGLIEIENNGSVALNDLLNGANGVNANCGPYAYVDTGVIGTDEIAVAFIYKTATAAPVGDFAVLDSSVDSRFVDTKNRPALAQTFEETATGGMLTVVVNHLKSKGSDCNDLGDPDLGDGQANCNLTRANAAAAMVDWLATDPTGSGDPDFLIIGDLNAYRNEDPIDNLELGADDLPGTADDYTDLMDAFLGGAAYSYVFDGQVGYLDHALANNDLLAQVTGVAPWHINADEIPVFDYNDGVQDAGEPSFQRESTALDIYESDAYRASDHDPLLVGLNLFVPNTPPVIEAITLPEPADVGETVTVSALFSDVDGTSDEPFTCTVDFGDGMGPQAGTVNGFTCEADTAYSESGFYSVTVTVADVHGDSDAASAEYVVIFDSSPRGTVGRGKFAVVAGDYLLDPSVSGRTVFFFSAKYRSTGLEGFLNMAVYEEGTQIFEMRSTGLDWLVLDGSVAIFAGSGQIDGSGDYGFRATAVTSRDGSGNFSEDLLRIVVWDKATGDVVFDNQSTCTDQSMLAIPCSTIKGGAIRTYIVD
jgi:predicted extracellular nuclease